MNGNGHLAPQSELPLAIIGAGPVGLAAAAHSAARGTKFVLLEAGAEPAAAVRRWAHVRLFSPWAYNVDFVAAGLLLRRGWSPPAANEYPTGAELRDRYLLPLADTPEIHAHLRVGTRVLSVSRWRHDKLRTNSRQAVPFELTVTSGGQQERLHASAVIDASGTLDMPNPLGASGVPAIGEADFAERIFYGVPDVLGRDRARYAGRRTLVVGAGHSAMHAVIDLARLRSDDPATRVWWATRGSSAPGTSASSGAAPLPEQAALLADAARLVAEGQVEHKGGVFIDRISDSDSGMVVGHAEGELRAVDEVVAATGYRPDLGMLRELRLTLDSTLETTPALSTLVDPASHGCGTVPPHGAVELSHAENDIYLVGMKSYGRAPTFLMQNGYEQVRSVVASLTGSTGEFDGTHVLSVACSPGLSTAAADCCTPTSFGCGPTGTCG